MEAKSKAKKRKGKMTLDEIKLMYPHLTEEQAQELLDDIESWVLLVVRVMKFNNFI